MNLIGAGPHERMRAFLEITSYGRAPSQNDVHGRVLASAEPAHDLPLICVRDPYALTDEESDAICSSFDGRFAAAAIQSGSSVVRDGVHPLLALGSQLRRRLGTNVPLNMAADLRDGAARIYDGGDTGKLGPTTRFLPAHQDGFMEVETLVTGLWAESAGASAATTFVQNIVELALDLACTDEAAFCELFHDDALCVVSKDSGRSVTTSILQVEDGKPRCRFRAASEHFDVQPGSGRAATLRAFEFLSEHSSYGSAGSGCIQLDRPGKALLFDNSRCVHGRTAYQDDEKSGRRRVLATKAWRGRPEPSSDPLLNQWTMPRHTVRSYSVIGHG